MTSDLNDLVVFVRVVETGSFSAAARRLSVPKSTVSRRIARLEKDLGVRLLQRTTRRIGLTDAGEIYYEHCTRALSDLEGAERTLTGMQQAPTGILRLTAPPDLAEPIVGELIREFAHAFPEVRVVAEMTTRVVDLVAEGFDLALRAGSLQDSSLIARRLSTFPIELYASPSYLSARGVPQHPQELRAHRCLLLGSDRMRTTWVLDSALGSESVDVEGHVASNDVMLLRRTAVDGRGIARLPWLTCVEEVRLGRLVRVLPSFTAGDSGVYAVFPSGHQLAPKVRACVELAAKVVAELDRPRTQSPSPGS